MGRKRLVLLEEAEKQLSYLEVITGVIEAKKEAETALSNGDNPSDILENLLIKLRLNLNSLVKK